jgi:hypothetical protein
MYFIIFVCSTLITLFFSLREVFGIVYRYILTRHNEAYSINGLFLIYVLEIWELTSLALILYGLLFIHKPCMVFGIILLVFQSATYYICNKMWISQRKELLK